MPIECTLLEGTRIPFDVCPKCGKPFEPFLRGQVQRGKREFGIGKKQDYCALICRACREIVGYESPQESKVCDESS